MGGGTCPVWMGPPSKPVPRRQLFNGGGGGNNLYEQWLWLWPLPPPGPVTFGLVWPEGSMEETTVQIDGALFRAAAAEAAKLWEPLTPEEQGAVIRGHVESSASGMMFGVSVGPDDTRPNQK